MGRHHWSICVEYFARSTPGPSHRRAGVEISTSRVDYREILSPTEFNLFARLRALRKQIAEAAGVSVYTILTNAQLAGSLARAVPRSKTALAEV